MATAAGSPCETASFIRPRFFAGQLLTEDDLGALTDYIVAKNRFHNSRLFGTGVVCGLQVECGRCDGQLVVGPGHALDCCGNDLVLTCQQTLDIAPLIRELSAHASCGCTDPCLPPSTAASSTTKEGDNPPPRPCKQYCLYARYTERQDQPVAAYPVAGDCDSAACEPTRIAEGIVFELRCPPTRSMAAMTRAAAEQGCSQLLDTDQLMTTATSFKDLATRLRYWLNNPGPALTAPEVSALRDGQDLDGVLRTVTDPDRVVALTRYLATVGGPFIRSRLLKVALPDGVDAARLEQNLKQVADALRGSYRTSAPSQLDTAAASAALQSWDAAHEAKPDLDSVPLAAFMHGAAVSNMLLDTARDQMTVISKQLQSAATCGPAKLHTDCSLQSVVDSLTPTWSATVERPDLERASSQLADASEVIRRFYADCLCAAVNPPCPPCDDTGVLLACIDVDRCKVVRICNTVRQFVLAPSTLRYWGSIDIPHVMDCCGPPQDQLQDRTASTAQAATRSLQLHLERLASTGMPGTLRDQLVPVSPAASDRAGGQEIAELKARLADLGRRIAELEKPEPVKHDPAKSEPARPEPVKHDPAKPEPAKPEPARPEPARPTTEKS